MPRLSRTLDDHLRQDGPKRILALDGGGVRGLLTLQVLARIEHELRARHSDPDLLLCDYFDLIGGTSTGAILAAGLAKGMTVAELVVVYRALPATIFPTTMRSYVPGWIRKALTLFRSGYDEAPLEAALKQHFGDMRLGSPELRTGLAICVKRIDTSSPWVLDNHPNGPFYAGRSSAVPNKDFSLVEIVRASTAAPTYFAPKRIVVAEGTAGWFVDGGVSPYNNPSLQLLMVATLKGHAWNWSMGPDKLLLVSVGAGTHYNRTTADVYSAERSAPEQVFDALLSVMTDTSDQAELLLQWLSDSPTGRRIDRVVGDLSGDQLAEAPRLSYVRYDAELDDGWLRKHLGVELTAAEVIAMRALDGTGSLAHLEKVGSALAERRFRPVHLPAAFDLAVPSGSPLRLAPTSTPDSL